MTMLMVEPQRLSREEDNLLIRQLAAVHLQWFAISSPRKPVATFRTGAHYFPAHTGNVVPR